MSVLSTCQQMFRSWDEVMTVGDTNSLPSFLAKQEHSSRVRGNTVMMRSGTSGCGRVGFSSCPTQTFLGQSLPSQTESKNRTYFPRLLRRLKELIKYLARSPAHSTWSYSERKKSILWNGKQGIYVLINSPGQAAEDEVKEIVRQAIRYVSWLSRREYWGHLDVSGNRNCKPMRVQASRKILIVRRQGECSRTRLLKKQLKGRRNGTSQIQAGKKQSILCRPVIKLQCPSVLPRSFLQNHISWYHAWTAWLHRWVGPSHLCFFSKCPMCQVIQGAPDEKCHYVGKMLC